jgi:hypothetical protein
MSDLIVDFLSIHGNISGGVIRTDLGGKLARSTALQTTVLKETKYIIEPTGVDCPSQNAGAEQWNLTLAITNRSLLYGSGLPTCYWSTSLLHASFTTTAFTQLQKSIHLKRGLENALASITFEYLVLESVSRKVARAKLSWITIILMVSLLDIQPQIRTYDILM